MCARVEEHVETPGERVNNGESARREPTHWHADPRLVHDRRFVQYLEKPVERVSFLGS